MKRKSTAKIDKNIFNKNKIKNQSVDNVKQEQTIHPTKKNDIISLVVFIGSFFIVLISIIPVLFPALLGSMISPYQVEEILDPFELGAWTFHFILINSVLLVVGLLYYFNKLPEIILRKFRRVYYFELTKKSSFIILLALFSIYIGLTIPELSTIEPWGDLILVEFKAQTWDYDGGNGIAGTDFRYMLLNLSINAFDNIRVIPFITSICLLVLTYFFTKEISGKRFAGILAVVIVLQSTVFFIYDTTASYDNVWTLLYLFSLYTVYKKWYISPISFVFSVFAKMITVAFLPLSLFFIFRTSLPKRDKIKVLSSYAVMIALLMGAYVFLDINERTPLDISKGSFNEIKFLRALSLFSSQMRFDGLVLTLILPLIVGLYLLSRKGLIQADSIILIIAGMLLLVPLLPALTGFNSQPYRFVPLVVFFAIGFGMLFSNKLSNRR